MRVAAALTAILLLAGCAGAADDGAPPPAEPEPEPTWSVACESAPVPVEPVGELALPCLGDRSEAVIGTDGERPLVVVLWASWCGPCIDEAPEIEAFHRAFGDRIDVIGVDTADTRDKGRWFAEDFDLTYPSVFDADEEVRIALGVPALPGIAFVAPDGAVAELVAQPGVTLESLTGTAEAAFDMELT